MNGYIAQRRDRFYVIIYEGRNPVTGKEQRRWHPAGTDRADAERIVKKLAAEETRRVEGVRSLTFGAYLTSQWLPAKKLHLATSTYRGYERNVMLHILPVLGRTGLRRVRYQQIESLYDSLLHPTKRPPQHRPRRHHHRRARRMASFPGRRVSRRRHHQRRRLGVHRRRRQPDPPPRPLPVVQAHRRQRRHPHPSASMI